MPYCLACGAGIDEFDSAYYARNMVCIPCYTRKASEIPMTGCARCGVRIKQEEARRRSGGMYCNYCNSELDRIARAQVCPFCGKKIEEWQKSLLSPSGKKMHTACAEAQQRRQTPARCIRCGREVRFYKVGPDALVVCLDCEQRSQSGSGTVLSAMMNRIGAMLG